MQEDDDQHFIGGRLTVSGHTITLSAGDFQGLCDLVGLLHHHDTQNTLGLFAGVEDAPNTFTLARSGSRERPEFDNGAIHETEGYIYRAMVRMGLSDDAMRDLFGHISDLVNTVHVQANGNNYKEAYQRGLADGEGNVMCALGQILSGSKPARKAA